VECAEKGVEAFKQMQPLPMVDDGHNGKEIVLDPIQWWASRAHDFPLLAQPAQHVLTIPASQAQSERLFTSAGLMVTKSATQCARIMWSCLSPYATLGQLWLS